MSTYNINISCSCCGFTRNSVSVDGMTKLKKITTISNHSANHPNCSFTTINVNNNAPGSRVQSQSKTSSNLIMQLFISNIVGTVQFSNTQAPITATVKCYGCNKSSAAVQVPQDATLSHNNIMTARNGISHTCTYDKNKFTIAGAEVNINARVSEKLGPGNNYLILVTTNTQG